jgi:hypothetical protein
MDEKPVEKTSSAEALKNTCHDCRFVSWQKRPKIMDATGFDDQLMFDDVDEIVYTCKAFGPSRGALPGLKLSNHAGETIGIVPLRFQAATTLQRVGGEEPGTCSAWEAPVQISTAKKAELDTVMSRAFARAGITRERE